MKKSELRLVIREEIQKVLKEFSEKQTIIMQAVTNWYDSSGTDMSAIDTIANNTPLERDAVNDILNYYDDPDRALADILGTLGPRRGA